ncbi:hypothetical protein DYB32_010215 [Aphanomyces invadans]|uniref:DDE Tnp4 domain-containing protein n=1 Tax=Aphanomyces invadans TaxID=157072 RepID=A0A418AGF0_9STRA|nr:hypothetical protein DYB32_010215 [Aphanomyces invadans]
MPQTTNNLEFASNYQRYAPVALSEDDPIENNDTNTPIIDSFRSIANNATFPQMTNFTVMEVFNIWSKVEDYVVSVLPNGYAIGCTNHHRGATADIEIFRRNAEFHLREMKKTTEQGKRITDHGPQPKKKADSWAILVDKGYQGLQEKFRAIHPTKSSGNASLPTETVIENRNISSDRIIVENFFGRLCSIWRVCADKYRWSEDLYDTIMRCCVALTNCHIETLALRAEDTNFFLQRLQRLRDISNETTRKRKLVQEKYRMKRRQRLSLGCTDESYPQF